MYLCPFSLYNVFVYCIVYFFGIALRSYVCIMKDHKCNVDVLLDYFDRLNESDEFMNTEDMVDVS
jgi:hypothetical protein